MNVCMIIIILVLAWYGMTICYKKERFEMTIANANTTHRVIRDSGRYELERNTTYYFDLPLNTSYLQEGTPREQVTLVLPSDISDGDLIVLVDKNTRFGWGNLSYDYKILVGDANIRGDLSSLNLFPYRGGYIILIWNKTNNSWESNGFKGNIQNIWNGWYKLEYKGFIAARQEQRMTSIYPSYMRIDATQNPVLITWYGGSEDYPINLIYAAAIGDLNVDTREITFQEYPLNMKSAMNGTVPKLLMLKNEIIMDLNKGGGWKKVEGISLNDKPQDLHELN